MNIARLIHQQNAFQEVMFSFMKHRYLLDLIIQFDDTTADRFARNRIELIENTLTIVLMDYKSNEKKKNITT